MLNFKNKKYWSLGEKNNKKMMINLFPSENKRKRSLKVMLKNVGYVVPAIKKAIII